MENGGLKTGDRQNILSVGVEMANTGKEKPTGTVISQMKKPT